MGTMQNPLRQWYEDGRSLGLTPHISPPTVHFHFRLLKVTQPPTPHHYHHPGHLGPPAWGSVETVAIRGGDLGLLGGGGIFSVGSPSPAV